MPLKRSPIVVLYLKKKKPEKPQSSTSMKRREGLLPGRSLIDEEGEEKMYELRTRTTRVIAKGIDLRFIAPSLAMITLRK